MRSCTLSDWWLTACIVYGQRCRARRVVPRARQEDDRARFQCSGEEIHPAATRERGKAPCIAMISSPLSLDPLSSPPR